MQFQSKSKGFVTLALMLVLTSTTVLIHHNVKLNDQDRKIFYGKSITYQDERKMLSNKKFYFNYNSYDIRSEDKLTVLAHARHLLKKPKLRIAINGYTDPKGTIPYNFTLGMLRAKAVADLLIAKGVSLDKINLISYGKQIAANEILHNHSITFENFRKAEIDYVNYKVD